MSRASRTPNPSIDQAEDHSERQPHHRVRAKERKTPGCEQRPRQRCPSPRMLGNPDRKLRVAFRHQPNSLELPVEELLRRARPLPPHEEMVIDDLTVEEGAAFLASLED